MGVRSACSASTREEMAHFWPDFESIERMINEAYQGTNVSRMQQLQPAAWAHREAFASLLPKLKRMLREAPKKVYGNRSRSYFVSEIQALIDSLESLAKEGRSKNFSPEDLP